MITGCPMPTTTEASDTAMYDDKQLGSSDGTRAPTDMPAAVKPVAQLYSSPEGSDQQQPDCSLFALQQEIVISQKQVRQQHRELMLMLRDTSHSQQHHIKQAAEQAQLLQQQEGKFQALQARLQEKESQLAQLQQHQAKVVDIAEKRKVIIEELVCHLQRKDSENEAQQQQMQQQQAEDAGLQQQLDQQREQYQQQQAETALLQHEIKEQKMAIQQLLSFLDHSDSERDALQQQIKQQQEKNAWLQQQLKQQTAQNEKLLAQLHEKDRQMKQQQEQQAEQQQADAAVLQQYFKQQKAQRQEVHAQLQQKQVSLTQQQHEQQIQQQHVETDVLQPQLDQPALQMCKPYQHNADTDDLTPQEAVDTAVVAATVTAAITPVVAALAAEETYDSSSTTSEATDSIDYPLTPGNSTNTPSDIGTSSYSESSTPSRSRGSTDIATCSPITDGISSSSSSSSSTPSRSNSPHTTTCGPIIIISSNSNRSIATSGTNARPDNSSWLRWWPFSSCSREGNSDDVSEEVSSWEPSYWWPARADMMVAGAAAAYTICSLGCMQGHRP